jgi:hypothetical protein
MRAAHALAHARLLGRLRTTIALVEERSGERTHAGLVQKDLFPMSFLGEP